MFLNPPNVFLAVSVLLGSIGVSWNPNPADQNVIVYTVYLDQGTPWQTLAPASCTPSSCSLTIVSLTEGKHQVWVTAKNSVAESGPSNVVVFNCKKKGNKLTCG